MAGLGRKDFEAGQVLSAADVNGYLMDQSVQRFADASARDTAIPTPTEGMVCYLDSTNDVLVYDGSQWVNFTGDITSVTAGTGLTGGGSEGSVTLDVDFSAVQPNVITTQGDLIIGNASGDAVRLPVGAADTVLTSDGTTLSFVPAGSGGADLYAAGIHTLNKPAGTYLISQTASSEGNTTINNFATFVTNGATDAKLVNLPSFTSLEIDLGALQYLSVNPLPGLFGYGLHFGDDIFIAPLLNGNIGRSINGVDWTEVTTPASSTLTKAVYGGGLWIVSFQSGGSFLTSNDSLTWTIRTSANTENCRGLAFDGTKFISAANGGTQSTVDGINWTSVTTPAINPFGIAYGDGVWVIVGAGGAIVSSTDGVSWTSRTSGTSLNFSDVTYGGGLFVATVENSTSNDNVFTSADGINWTGRNRGNGLVANGVFYSVRDNIYVVIGNSGLYQFSSDTITWTSQSIGSSAQLFGGAFGNDLYVVLEFGAAVKYANAVTGQRPTGTATLLLQELPVPIQP